MQKILKEFLFSSTLESDTFPRCLQSSTMSVLQFFLSTPVFAAISPSLFVESRLLPLISNLHWNQTPAMLSIVINFAPFNAPKKTLQQRRWSFKRAREEHDQDVNSSLSCSVPPKRSYESHLWDSFLYPVETRGPVMVPGAVTPGVCIRGPAFRIQSIVVRQFLDFSGRVSES